MVVVVAEQLCVIERHSYLSMVDCIQSVSLCWHNCMIIDEEHNSYVTNTVKDLSLVSCLSETMIRARVGSSLLLLKFLFKSQTPRQHHVKIVFALSTHLSHFSWVQTWLVSD